MTTKLSVNLNKVALIRNSRGQNFPDLCKLALDCEKFGADGITIHPRPDQRHAKYQDIHDLKETIQTELNIEGYPTERFLSEVIRAKPDQCTLVPDPPGILTSNEGWDTKKELLFLKQIVQSLKNEGIRTSLFMNPDLELIKWAKETGTDRIELYTGEYAKIDGGCDIELEKHQESSTLAMELDLGLNAGHDLNLTNLKKYKTKVTNLLEVSIGHALVVDSIYYGIQNTIRLYKRLLI